MDHVIGLKCTLCGTLYAAAAISYTCPKDDGTLDVIYDYDRVAAAWTSDAHKDSASGVWRYKTLLPIDYEATVPPLVVGNTPLYRSEAIAQAVGVREVWIKDDGRNPTGSLKDRASTLVVARAMGEGR